MQLLIDSDPIVYRIGFASQKPRVTALAESVGGGIHQAHFVPGPNGTALAQMKDWLSKNGLELLDREDSIQPDEPEQAEYGARDVVKTIVEATTKQYPGTSIETHVLLSGKTNFRNEIAKQKGYKANRTKARPVHYDVIREYLIREHAGRVIEGQEADDEIAILATQFAKAKTPYVIATIDKDLDQIAGSHYDYRLHVFYYVSEPEARARFWIQVLCGDATDNIPGIAGVGFKTAEKIIRPLLDAGATDGDLWRAVLDAYGQNYEHALETARLVYLRREYGELWGPST